MNSTQKIVVGILAVAVVVFLGITFLGGNTTDDVADTAPDQIEVDLTVNLDDLATRSFDRFSDEFLDYSMPHRARERVDLAGFSDAVSFPFFAATDNPDALYEELLEEVMRNPVVGDMAIRGLMNIRLSTGKTIGELNPWMGEFVSKMDAAMAVPAGQHPRGNEYWLTKKANSEGVLLNGIYVTQEYRNYASLTCILLDRLINKGVETKESSENWVLNYTSEGALVRTDKADYQENKAALILTYLRKNDTAEFVIGFNLLDKRLEKFDPAKPVTPPPSTTPPPATTTPPPATTTPPPSSGPYPMVVTITKELRNASRDGTNPDYNKTFEVKLYNNGVYVVSLWPSHNQTASYTFSDRSKVGELRAEEVRPTGSYHYISGDASKTPGNVSSTSFAFVNEYRTNPPDDDITIVVTEKMTVTVTKTLNNNSQDGTSPDRNRVFEIRLYNNGAFVTSLYPSANNSASYTFPDRSKVGTLRVEEITPSGNYYYVSGNTSQTPGNVSSVSFPFVNEYRTQRNVQPMTVTVTKTLNNNSQDGTSPDRNKTFEVRLYNNGTFVTSLYPSANNSASYTFADRTVVGTLRVEEVAPTGNYFYVSGNTSQAPGNVASVSFPFVNEYRTQRLARPLTIYVSKALTDAQPNDQYYPDYNKTFAVDIYGVRQNGTSTLLTTLYPSANSSKSYYLADSNEYSSIRATEQKPNANTGYEYVSGDNTVTISGNSVSFSFTNRYTIQKQGTEPTPSGDGYQGQPNNPGNPPEETRPVQPPENHNTGNTSPGSDTQVDVPPGTVTAPNADPLPSNPPPPTVVVDQDKPTVTGDPGAP